MPRLESNEHAVLDGTGVDRTAKDARKLREVVGMVLKRDSRRREPSVGFRAQVLNHQRGLMFYSERQRCVAELHTNDIGALVNGEGQRACRPGKSIAPAA